MEIVIAKEPKIKKIIIGILSFGSEIRPYLFSIRYSTKRGRVIDCMVSENLPCLSKIPLLLPPEVINKSYKQICEIVTTYNLIYKEVDFYED